MPGDRSQTRFVDPRSGLMTGRPTLLVALLAFTGCADLQTPNQKPEKETVRTPRFFPDDKVPSDGFQIHVDSNRERAIKIPVGAMLLGSTQVHVDGQYRGQALPNTHFADFEDDEVQVAQWGAMLPGDYTLELVNSGDLSPLTSHPLTIHVHEAARPKVEVELSRYPVAWADVVWTAGSINDPLAVWVETHSSNATVHVARRETNSWNVLEPRFFELEDFNYVQSNVRPPIDATIFQPIHSEAWLRVAWMAGFPANRILVSDRHWLATNQGDPWEWTPESDNTSGDTSGDTSGGDETPSTNPVVAEIRDPFLFDSYVKANYVAVTTGQLTRDILADRPHGIELSEPYLWGDFLYASVHAPSYPAEVRPGDHSLIWLPIRQHAAQLSHLELLQISPIANIDLVRPALRARSSYVDRPPSFVAAVADSVEHLVPAKHNGRPRIERHDPKVTLSASVQSIASVRGQFDAQTTVAVSTDGAIQVHFSHPHRETVDHAQIAPKRLPATPPTGELAPLLIAGYPAFFVPYGEATEVHLLVVRGKSLEWTPLSGVFCDSIAVPPLPDDQAENSSGFLRSRIRRLFPGTIRFED